MSNLTSNASDGHPEPHRNLFVADDDIRTLSYHPDGRRVVTGSGDGTLKVWDLERGEQEGTQMKHHAREVCEHAVTRDGKKIVSICGFDPIKVWDVKSHELVTEWTHPHAFPSLTISPDDRLVAVGGTRDVEIYTMQGELVNRFVIDPSIWIRPMAFSPNGKKLARSSDERISFYDIESGKRLLVSDIKDVTHMLWSPDGKLFASSERTDTTTIRIWDSATGQTRHLHTGHTAWITSLSLSPDGLILASASWDCTVRFWNATSGHPVGRPLEHSYPVKFVRFSPSGEFVTSGGVRNICTWLSPRLDRAEHSPGITQVNSTPWFSPIPPPAFPISTMSPSNILSPLGTSIPLGTTAQSLPDPSSCATPISSSRPPQTTSLGTRIPPPPDLTNHLIRISDQYSAGGSFGDVYRCRLQSGSVPKEVAVKAFRFQFVMEAGVSDRSDKMLRRELGIWKRLKHANIVPFMGVAYGFGMTGSLSLVSLWMPNGSLHNFLAKHDARLDVTQRLKFLLDISTGLQYLHSFRIVHGDLNCNNILVDADQTARLVDFGYSSLIGHVPEALSYLRRSTARPGALRWSAPEQVDAEDSFTRTTESDIYSFGCVALQVLSGKEPWSEVREDCAVILRLAKGQKPGRPVSRVIEDSHWDFIQCCWSQTEQRPAAEVIISRIKSFLDGLPSLPLGDSRVSNSGHDSVVSESSSSHSQATTEGFSGSIDASQNNQRKINVGSEK